MLSPMAILKFTDAAETAWRQLEADPSMASMLDRLNDLLDILEADPTDERCRRRRFAPPGVWCVTIRTAMDEYAVLWEPDDAGNPVVVHIGPSTFT
jgi:hypothetical protein